MLCYAYEQINKQTLTKTLPVWQLSNYLDNTLQCCTMQNS